MAKKAARKKAAADSSGSVKAKVDLAPRPPRKARAAPPPAPASEETPPAPADGEADEPVATLPVVGIGASAGGLEAITDLLRQLAPDTGMAFVFVQHLDPHHKSSLVEILSRTSKLPVREIVDGASLEANRFYVAPPDHAVALLHGHLQLMTCPAGSGRRHPIDYFFGTLAEELGNRAIGVVLSGTGADGTAGLRAIKAEGGITLAQSPETSQYTGMPESAVATGQVDFVLDAPSLARELARIVRHPHFDGSRQRPAPPVIIDTPDALQKLFVILRKGTGVDFSQYKQSTIERRLSRRMVLHKIESLKHYVKYLEQTPGEVTALFEDMLINVTEFFRDPEAFETLKRSVFPRMFADRGADAPIRIWVPACATGEEPYSIAMALFECVGPNEAAPPLQLFATDVSDAAIEQARTGRFSEKIAERVGPERLRRFFSKVPQGYQICKMIRDTCILAKQNVTRDPPFSNLDFLSCRNLLIYMGPAFQRRIIPTFHYALKPGGHLMLGPSETTGGFPELFTLVDRTHKIYAKKPVAVRMPMDFGQMDFRPRQEAPLRPVVAVSGGASDPQKEADRVVLQRFGPPGVLINGDMDILQFRGQTGRYLEPAPGAATLNLLKMAREGLALDLRATIHKAGKTGDPVRKEGLPCRHDGRQFMVDIEVIPLRREAGGESYFVVLFEDVAPPSAEKAAGRGATRGATDRDREITRLRDELAQTKETLQHIIEEHEATNEELRAANEEIQSANEELQSTNEELETAKEELQSTNEELTTLNAELESQNIELTQAIDDFNNLHNSVSIPVVLLGNDLRIRSFTPPAERALKLIPADSGRPVGALKLGIQVDHLEEKVLGVLERLDTYEQEVRAFDGRWYMMRIRPYRTAENKITGAVLVLVDIHDRKVIEEDLKAAEGFAQTLLATVRAPVVVLDGRHCVKSASAAFYRRFHLIAAQAVGRPITDLLGGAASALRALLEGDLSERVVVEDFVTEQELPGGGRVRLAIDARRLERPNSEPIIVLAFEELRDG